MHETRKRKRSEHPMDCTSFMDAVQMGLSREELLTFEKTTSTTLVKEQKMSKDKVLAQLHRLDAVDSIHDTIEGMVIQSIRTGTRYKVKSFLYLLCTRRKLPSVKWLTKNYA